MNGEMDVWSAREAGVSVKIECLLGIQSLVDVLSTGGA